MRSRGVALLLLLGTIIVTGILSAVIANIILNQSRFSQHQVNRLRAYYSAMAVMQITRDNLFNGTWSAPSSYDNYHADADIPYPVDIMIGDPDPNGISTIRLTVDYTYSES